jgi:hypothetical protein
MTTYSIYSQSWEGCELKSKMEVTLIHLGERSLMIKILGVLGDHM